MLPRKRSRNRVYVVCGVTMIACFAIIAFLKSSAPTKSIFLPESIAVAAFALAWLTKGETILKDKNVVGAINGPTLQP